MARASTGDKRAFTIIGYAAQFFYGGWFLFHGLNWWLGFFPEKSFAPGAQGFIPELIRLHIFTVVKVLEVVIGLALLSDLFVPLAIVAAFPITFVIATLNFSKGSAFGIAVGVAIVVLNVLMALGHLDRYRPMLARRGGRPNAAGLHAWAGGGPAPAPRSDTLPPAQLIPAILLGIAVPAALTYASIYFAKPPSPAGHQARSFAASMNARP